MAVVIIEQGGVCDGYDVRIRLADGRVRYVHFLEPPLNVQVACNAFETDLLANDTLQEVEANLKAISINGATAIITFNHSTVDKNVVALRVAFRFMRAEEVCRASEFVLTLTDTQIKNAFNINQTQCNALRTRLQAKVSALTTLRNQVGE